MFLAARTGRRGGGRRAWDKSDDRTVPWLLGAYLAGKQLNLLALGNAN